jgi:hypothetical protein
VSTTFATADADDEEDEEVDLIVNAAVGALITERPWLEFVEADAGTAGFGVCRLTVSMKKKRFGWISICRCEDKSVV